MATSPIDFNMDIAVPLILSKFPANTMNPFFLALYLQGFPDDDTGTQDYLDIMHEPNPLSSHEGSRLMHYAPERRLWTAVKHCYGLDFGEYRFHCENMYYFMRDIHRDEQGQYGDQSGLDESMKQQVNAMWDAIQSDMKWWDPKDADAFIAEHKQSVEENVGVVYNFYESQVLRHMKYSRPGALTQVAADRGIQENGDGPITVLKVLTILCSNIGTRGGCARKPTTLRSIPDA